MPPRGPSTPAPSPRFTSGLLGAPLWELDRVQDGGLVRLITEATSGGSCRETSEQVRTQGASSALRAWGSQKWGPHYLASGSRAKV